MKYTKNDVLAYVNEEDVKFIRLVFCDLNGNQKNISIMPNELSKAFDEGFKIDSTSISGYEKAKKITLYPDPNTISLLPWRPSQGRVIRMFCDISAGDLLSPRKELKNTVEETGLDNIHFFQRFEFYAFKLDDEGNNTKIPYDKASLMDIAPLDKGEKIRRDICLNLLEMEIETCGSFHAIGPGQNAICLSPTTALNAAENSITFESVTKTMAAMNGLEADFSSSPIENEVPSIQVIGISNPGEKTVEYYNNLKAGFETIRKYLTNQSASFENTVECEGDITIKGIAYSSNFYMLYSDILKTISGK